ncbi:MAG: class I SAM-dependent methyltransferase [Nitriliruptoraceae bacterium]
MSDGLSDGLSDEADDGASAAVQDGTVPLTLTGERTLPGIPDERYWFIRHVVAYRAAQRAVGELAAARPSGDVAVLDAGCGEGYGLELLRAAGADRVIGADLDERTVAHARAVYGTADPDIEVVVAELRQLPLPDDAVALCVSFQVIEHLHDIPGYLAELQRVTVPGGTIMIATPNRLTFTPGSDTPVNPFHTVEFTATELTRLLARAGLDVEVVQGIHHAGGVAAAEHDRAVSVPHLLAAGEPPSWPGWLRQLVHRVEEADFRLDATELDASLDLLATCRVVAR